MQRAALPDLDRPPLSVRPPRMAAIVRGLRKRSRWRKPTPHVDRIRSHEEVQSIVIDHSSRLELRTIAAKTVQTPGSDETAVADRTAGCQSGHATDRER